MRLSAIFATTAAVLMGGAMTFALTTVPGNNIVGGGDFEDVSKVDFVGDSGTVNDYKYYKHEHSPRTQAEIDVAAAPVRAWQFHPDYDLGRWMPVWGVGGSAPGDYDGQTGISVYDDPRSLWDDVGSQWTAPVSQHNISVDPLNPSNHVMEGIFFRSWMGQFMAPPVNHVAGTATIDFDYYWNNWVDPYTQDAASIFHVFVYGVDDTQLPDWPDRWGPGAQSSFGGPNGADVLWTSPNWSEWGWSGPGSDEPDILSLGNQWNNLATDHPDRIEINITTPYDYYYIAVWQCLYSEPHPYFWSEGGKPADTFAVAIDNLELRLPVPLGDVNQDTAVNNLDIAPFITLLTGGGYMIEADTNQDGFVNNLDIAPFITLLTSGAQAIPEPATVSLLVLGAAFLRRRR